MIFRSKELLHEVRTLDSGTFWLDTPGLIDVTLKNTQQHRIHGDWCAYMVYIYIFIIYISHSYGDVYCNSIYLGWERMGEILLLQSTKLASFLKNSCWETAVLLGYRLFAGACGC